MKAQQYRDRYDRSDKGRERDRRRNATDAAKLNKALYDLTRIRAY